LPYGSYSEQVDASKTPETLVVIEFILNRPQTLAVTWFKSKIVQIFFSPNNFFATLEPICNIARLLVMKVHLTTFLTTDEVKMALHASFSMH